MRGQAVASSSLSRVPPTSGEAASPPIPGAGHPLSAAVRARYETQFKYDFSKVRIHTDAGAGATARSLGSKALTVGPHVVFAPGKYAPETQAGGRLLAHELTHVVQQERLAAPQLVQRQGEGATEQAAPPKEWYMLKVPPVVEQQSLTCWAAALSSWLEVLGAQTISFQDITLRYVGKACIDTDNALPYSTAREVYAEWGAEFTLYDKAALTGAKVRELLQAHGHLLFAQTGSALGHVLVIYGMGFDEKRQPNPNFISVMDPMRSGGYANVALTSLSFPIEVGHLTKRTRPAPCLSRAAHVPEED